MPRSHRSRPGLFAPALIALLTVGCAHTEEAPAGPPIETEIEVTGLKKEEREVLEKSVCALPRVEGCELKVRRRRARLRFTYTGTLPQLRRALAELPHPGLEVKKATVKLEYLGFDNIPPEVSFRKPEPGSVHTTSEVEVIVEVPARDTEAVLIGEEEATRLQKGVYIAHLKLEDGRQSITARALDEEKNEGVAQLPILVDTTPPVLAVSVQVKGLDRATITGQVEDAEEVLIDGQEVDIGMFGRFQKGLPADPDKSTALVVAIDEHGNESVLKVKLESGFQASSTEKPPGDAPPDAGE